MKVWCVCAHICCCFSSYFGHKKWETKCVYEWYFSWVWKFVFKEKSDVWQQHLSLHKWHKSDHRFLWLSTKTRTRKISFINTFNFSFFVSKIRIKRNSSKYGHRRTILSSILFYPITTSIPILSSFCHFDWQYCLFFHSHKLIHFIPWFTSL